MEIKYHTKFLKEYRDLPVRIKYLTEKKEGIFHNNPYDKSLSTHKLKGQLSGLLAFYINDSYRVIFRFDDGVALFLHIGSHDLYR